MLLQQAHERQATVDQGVGGRAASRLGPSGPTTEGGGAQGGGRSKPDGRTGRAWRSGWLDQAGPPDVAMVQAADFWNRDDPAEFRPLNWPAGGCILLEREVGPRSVIVRKVAGQGAAQVPFAEDEDVIETLAPDRADEPLRERVLPRAVRRRASRVGGTRGRRPSRDRGGGRTGRSRPGRRPRSAGRSRRRWDAR